LGVFAGVNELGFHFFFTSSVLKSEPAAFDISLHTGCRLRETRIPANCMGFEENKNSVSDAERQRRSGVFRANANRTASAAGTHTQIETEIHRRISVSTVAAVGSNSLSRLTNHISLSIACASTTS
jgi:hypothetical protein